MFEQAVSPLVVRLLGPFKVTLNGDSLPRLKLRHGQWLLALLALRGGREVERGWLAGTLWPDSTQEAALASLRNCLPGLRRALGPEAHRLRAPTSRTLSLDLTDASVDVIEFDAAIARGQERSDAGGASLEQAVALYRGPLLEGCAEEWAFQERQVREQAFLAALETLAEQALSAGELAAAERHLRRVIAVDPLREAAHRSLMQALAAGGSYAAATLVYRDLKLLLHRDAQTGPDAATVALYEQIRAEARRRARSARPAPLSAPAAASPRNGGGPPVDPEEAALAKLLGASPRRDDPPCGPREARPRRGQDPSRSAEAGSPGVPPLPGSDPAASARRRPGNAPRRAGHAGQKAASSDFTDPSRRRSRPTREGGFRNARPSFQWGDQAQLPAPRSSLVGRAEEVADLRELLLQESVGLVTLTGPGGTGKTRLALQAAAELVDPFPDGVFFVALASIQAADRVLAAVAQALEVRETEGESLPLRLAEHLREKRLLLVLDNFEHVIAAAPEISALLAAAPRLKVLVTSREVLRLQGEHEFPVPPLAVPGSVVSGQWLVVSGTEKDRKALTTNHQPLSTFPSVQLFVERARAAKRDFVLTEETAPVVAEICRRLDGLPLAIELAAAWVKILSPAALLSRLAGACDTPSPNGRRPAANGRSPEGRPQGSPLQFLTGGARDLPARHQTLRDAIAWSYALLDEREQALFRRLSVFVGGCAVAALQGDFGFRVPSGRLDFGLGPTKTSKRPEPLTLSAIQNPKSKIQNPLPFLASLVDKSLLQQDESPDGEPRFRMLETIREFGQECLEACGEADAAREQHARWCLALVEQRDGEEPPWLDRLEREHDNLRAALGWCLKAVDSGWWLVVSRDEQLSTLDPAGLTPNHHPLSTAFTETAVRIVMGLYRLWYLRGYWSEGRDWLTAVLKAGGPSLDARTRAMLLRRVGQLAWLQGDYAAARSRLEECLALYRALGSAEDLPGALNALGEVARTQGDYPAARALFAESLALLRAQNDLPNMAWALQALGEVAHEQGDPGARALMEESLALFEAVGDRRGVSFALSYLGQEARARGDLPQSRRLHEQSLAIQRELGHKGSMARSLRYLGALAAAEDDLERAGRRYQESLDLGLELGDKRTIAACLEGLAGLGVRGWGAGVRGRGLGVQAYPFGKNGSVLAGPRPGRLLLDPQPPINSADQAASLLGSATMLRERIGAPRPPSERLDYERHVGIARAALGEAAFAAAWEDGRKLSLDVAVRTARALID